MTVFVMTVVPWLMSGCTNLVRSVLKPILVLRLNLYRFEPRGVIYAIHSKVVSKVAEGL